ncbi:MAG: hypothetical protein JXB17_04800 [Bacteroidales bacterium]|nr:hypothetical protein [Bacteroidales bacterium]
MDIDEIVDRMLDSSSQPSEIIKNIIEFENDHFIKFHSQYKDFILHFEHSFDLLVQLIYFYNFRKNDLKFSYRSYQFMILKNSLGSIYSSFERLIKGFYVDSLHCLRIPFESLLRIFYITYFPQDAESVFSNKMPKGKRSFNVTNFITQNLKTKWDTLYNLLSMFSHSNNFQTLTEINDLLKNAQKEPLQFRLKYDSKFSTIPINFSYFILLGFLRTFYEFFVIEIESSYKKEILDNLNNSIIAIKTIMDASPSSLKMNCSEYDEVFKKLHDIENAKNP